MKFNFFEEATHKIDAARDAARHHVDDLRDLDLKNLDPRNLDLRGLDPKKLALPALRKAVPAIAPEKKPSIATRFLHDLGLAVWFGGSVFGIMSLNPSVEVLDDPEERGKMVDEGWARFQPYGALGLLTALITHVLMQRRHPRRATSCFKQVALLKDFFMVGACVTSVASLALGEYIVDDHEPIDNATEPNQETSESTEKAQGGLSIAAIAQLTCGIGLLACSAILAHERDKK